MNRTTPSYPAVGSTERYDAIVARGTSLRRQRRLLTGAGVLVAATVVVALAIGFRALSDSTADHGVKADTSGATALNPAAPSGGNPAKKATPEFLAVESHGSSWTITLNDERAAVPLDPTLVAGSSLAAQQCVTLTAVDSSGRPVAEGSGCRPLDGTTNGRADAVPVDLRTSNGVALGCATVVERLAEPLTLRLVPASTTFAATIPPGLAPGEYTLSISGVSGFGDGCATGTTSSTEGQQTEVDTVQIEDDAQLENSANVEKSFTVN